MSFRFESDNGDSTLTLLSENITLIQSEATLIAFCVRIKLISMSYKLRELNWNWILLDK